MNHDELMNFFEVLTTLRDEYAKGDNSHKVEMISSLAQVAVEVIKCGTIPHSFQLTHLEPYDVNYFITPVEKLFKRLEIGIEIYSQGSKFLPTGVILYVTFVTKK